MTPKPGNPGGEAGTLRVRVLHLLLNVEAGGLEAVVLNLISRSDARRFEHRVVCLEGLGALEPAYRAAGIPIEGLHARNRALLLYRLAQRLRHWPPDVLHSHNAKPHLIGAVARTLGLVPKLLHTKHGQNEPWIRRQLVWNHLAARGSDLVVTVSEDAASVARNLERVPERVLRVLHNGIDVDGWAPAREPRRAEAVCVARFHPIKDHATLLRAARLVLDRRPDFRLTLAGDGPERQRLEALSADLGLGEAIRFAGHQKDVRQLLAASDVFVMASSSEGVSLSILEAMAASLPVVATAVGGNHEVVADGETGILVPAGSPEALADALLAVLDDPDRARRLGAAGRLRVEERFSLSKMVSRYEDLYWDLAARAWDLAARARK